MIGAPEARARRQLKAVLAAFVVASVGIINAASSTFVAPRSLGSTDSPRPRHTALNVAAGGRDGATKQITLLRPKARGFQPSYQSTERELAPVVPGFAKQKSLFVKYVKEGHPVSEVFVRFEGKTPWKNIGEIATKEGKFDESVRAMWPIFVEHSYYLSRKIRFWLPTEHPIQFGYANEEAEIVPVRAGPLREGTSPLELKGYLNSCGFLGAKKPRHWRHMHTNAKEIQGDSKHGWFTNPEKAHLLDQGHNAKAEIMNKMGRYNPDKMRYDIKWKTVKRGLVLGVKDEKTSNSRPNGKNNGRR